jgi:multidrug efflux pump subunit AcrB
LTPVEHEVLDEMRKGKEMRGRETLPRSERMVQKLADAYVRGIKWTMETKFKRMTTYILPIILLILSFIVLAPKIGFKLFPSGDNPSIMIDITAKQ